MSAKRMHVLFLGIIGLLVVGLLAGTYYTNTLLTKKAEALTNYKAQSLALQQEQNQLRIAKKQILSYADLEKVTQTIVPEDKSQAEAIRQIVNIAGTSGVDLASITFSESTLGNTAKPGLVSTSPAPVVPSSGSSKTNSLSQLTPVKAIPGIYVLPITIQSNGGTTYHNLISFLDSLEHNRRTAQVSSLNISPDAKNVSLVNFTVTLNEYIKP